MILHPVKIGSFTAENNVFCAPLAGYTNFAFRELFSRYGAGLSYTEMVSAKGLAYGSENTKDLLYTEDGERCAVQIFGNDPALMRRACESEELAPFSVVDINMGCPVPKIFKNGEGSALLSSPELAEKIVSECVKSGKNVTVKFRIGLSADKIVAKEFAKRMAGAGASLLTIHGRTKDKFYAGEVDYFSVAEAKNAVEIPVIANGGIFSVKDADAMLEKTGADGVMLARALLFDPQVLCSFTGAPTEDKYEMIERQLLETRRTTNERFTTVFMRKMVAFYLKGRRGSAKIKERLFACATPEEVLSVAKEIFN